MVITLLKGGLGNQMFQYAAAKGCLQKGENIFFDLSFLKKHSVTTKEFTARNFELDIFPNTDFKIITKLYLKLYDGQSKISKRLKKVGLIKHTLITQRSHELVDTNGRNKITYLDGFFQSEKYFNHIKKEILNDFQFPDLDESNELIRQRIISSDNATAIHIRRGDYITNKAAAAYHGILPLNYYEKSLSLLFQNINVSKIDVFVFTNDIDWVRDNFKIANVKFHFIEGNDARNSWKDMALMAACKHHIIANSSFSWWGAWLSERQGSVYAPYNWFAPDVEYNINDFIPHHWTIIN